MLELRPNPPHAKRPRYNAWTPKDIMNAPEPPSKEAREAEQARLEQSALAAEQAGGRMQKNRNKVCLMSGEQPVS